MILPHLCTLRVPAADYPMVVVNYAAKRSELAPEPRAYPRRQTKGRAASQDGGRIAQAAELAVRLSDLSGFRKRMLPR